MQNSTETMNLNENKRIAIGNPQPAHVVNPSTGSWWNPSFSMPSIPKTPNAQEARLSTLWIIIISMLTYLSNLKHVAKSKYFSWRHITDSPLLQKLFSLQIVLSSVNPVSHMENHFNKKGSWDQIATKMRFQTNQRVKTIFSYFVTVGQPAFQAQFRNIRFNDQVSFSAKQFLL